MNKILILKELKRNRKNLLIWLSIILGFTIMILSIYPFMSEMGEGLETLLSSIPDELAIALGMNSDSWSNIIGFYSTYYGVYIVVLISIYTATTGGTIISKEERDRTSEFLFTKPITRSGIFRSKMLVLLILVFLVFVLQSLLAYASLEIFKTKDYEFTTWLIMQANGLMIILFYTALGVLLSMNVPPKRNIMGLVVGLTFGAYIINALSKSADAINWMGYISPFKYMDFSISSPDYHFNWLAAIGFVLISVAMVAFAEKQFVKKDIAG
jgi:ABC-2 type transport system permease protein